MRNLTGALVVLIVPTFLLGCASPAYYPWPIHTEEGEARCVKPGMTYSEVNTLRVEHFKSASALDEPYFNPHCRASWEVAKANCSGTVYYPITTIRCQKVTYDNGVVVDVSCMPYRANFWNTPRNAKTALR